MDDLGFDFGNAVAWFPHEQEQPYVLVRMTAQHVALLEAAMAEPLRRCYITDEVLQAAANRHGLTLFRRSGWQASGCRGNHGWGLR